MKYNILFFILTAFCAATALPHIAQAQGIPAKPAAPAKFTAREVNDFITFFDGYVEEYVNLARTAAKSRDTSKLDALANTKGAQVQQRGEAIASKLRPAEIARFSQYTEKQAARMEAAGTAAFAAADAREQEIAQAAAAKRAAAKPPPPPAPAASPAAGAYASAEVNAFVAKFDPYVNEYLRLAGEAAKTGDISKFKAFDDSPESTSLKAKANSLSETLFDDQTDGPPFRSYLNDKLRTMFTANRAAKQAAALSGAPSAPPVAPAASSAAYASAEVNAFVGEFDSFLAEYERLAVETAQTGDKAKFDNFGRTKVSALQAKTAAVEKLLADAEKPRFKAWTQSQMNRLMTAYGVSRNMNPNAQAATPPPPAPEPEPQPATDLEIPKPFDTPEFSDSNLAAFVVEYEAYVEDYIARANAVIHGGDKQAFYDYSNKMSPVIDQKRNTAIKKISMEEYNVFKDYYWKQSQRTMAAYRAVMKLPDKKKTKPAASSTFDVSAQAGGSVDLGSGVTQAERDKAQAQLAALLGGASAGGPVTIPPKPARPIISSSGEANSIFKEMDDAIEEIITTLGKDGLGAAAKLQSSGFQQRMQALSTRAERLKITLSDADKVKVEAYMEKQNERLGLVMKQMIGGLAQNPDVQNAVAARMKNIPTEQDINQISAAMSEWQAAAAAAPKPALPVFSNGEVNAFVRDFDRLIDDYIVALRAAQAGDNTKMQALEQKYAHMRNSQKNMLSKLSGEEQKKLQEYFAQRMQNIMAELMKQK